MKNEQERFEEELMNQLETIMGVKEELDNDSGVFETSSKIPVEGDLVEHEGEMYVVKRVTVTKLSDSPNRITVNLEQDDAE